ncbi:MAG: hypothetical protein M1816_008255 [Peltula sp. TS41687]|nr:MAG: hypothetical protein M1816_008255 [Peltula sp. TS41687]
MIAHGSAGPFPPPTINAFDPNSILIRQLPAPTATKKQDQVQPIVNQNIAPAAATIVTQPSSDSDFAVATTVTEPNFDPTQPMELANESTETAITVAQPNVAVATMTEPNSVTTQPTSIANESNGFDITTGDTTAVEENTVSEYTKLEIQMLAGISPIGGDGPQGSRAQEEA